MQVLPYSELVSCLTTIRRDRRLCSPTDFFALWHSFFHASVEAALLGRATPGGCPGYFACPGLVVTEPLPPLIASLWRSPGSLQPPHHDFQFQVQSPSPTFAGTP